jgi:hypothetical protein
MSTREHKEMFRMGNFLFQVVWNMNVLLPLLVNFAFKYVSQKIQIQDWWELNWTQQPWTYNISFVGTKTNAIEECTNSIQY